MKKFFKALALVLALALVIGVVPAQATSAKIKAKKTLYVDGAKGTNADGTKTSSYKERVAIYKLAGAKKADKEDHKFTAKIKSGDSVTVSKNYVYAAGLGKSVVELFKDGESLGTSVITVKKNATADTLTITEFEDGKEVVCGVEYTVTLPRKGVDSDERRLFVDDKAVADKEDAPRAYAVKFTKAGDHKVKFEAFQSAELDKATASKEITVKAVMPQPVSAKQVSASSFAVEFEGNMEGLISKDDITNQMIYYLIAKEPVVTGVIKSVEVKDAVVTVTMYAKFNPDTDYYFAYGDVEPIKFHTAKNDIKYATSLKLLEESAYYVGEETDIKYAFYNEDGVQLEVNEIPNIEVTSDYAYNVGTKIYFHTAGAATIKATIITGYDDETNKAITLTDTLTVNGVVKTATQTGKVYSFGAADEATKGIHQIRITPYTGAVVLSVQYTLSDDSKATINSIDTGYSIKSTDETVAMIDNNKVYGINAGTATIVLYKGTDVVDAFPITVLEANRVGTATATLSQSTLNTYTAADQIVLTVNGKDLDSQNRGGYTVTVEQLENNDVATGVTFAAQAWDAGTHTRKMIIDRDALTGVPADRTKFATVRIVVKVKDENNTEILNKVLSFVASYQDEANTYKIVADETALDTSIKNWVEETLLTKEANIGVVAVKTTSYGDFYVNDEQFALLTSAANIPSTGAAGTKANFVICSFPKTLANLEANTVTYDGAWNNAASVNNSVVTVTAFPATGASISRANAGTYSFTGYHVEYTNAPGTVSHEKGVRTTLGAANVVVSKNDVMTTVAIKDGTAATYALNHGSATGLKNIFKATWDGISSDATGTEANRVNFVSVLDESYDDVTESWYCRKIRVSLLITRSGENITFTQDVNIGKLFKDK